MSLAVVTLAYAVGGAEPAPSAVSPPVKEFSAEFAGSTGLEPLSDPAVDALATTTTPVRRTTSVAEALTDVATTAPVEARPRGDEPQAVALLHRAAQAPSKTAYSGRREVTWSTSSGESEVTLQIEHAPDQGTSYAVLDGGDTATATFLAQDDAATKGALGGEPVDLLISSYDVSIAGSGFVAGRRATIVTASRDGEPVATFWIDDASGLLLQRVLFDGGQPVRVSRLSDVKVSDKGFMKHLPPEFEAPVATRLSTDFAPALTDKGWACPGDLPNNFHLTLLHRLQGTHDVMHAAYSDGLSTVSVFEERGTLETDALSGYDQVTSDGSSVWVQEGLPTVAIWQADDTVYTLVTDAPSSTTAEVVAALPHQQDAGSGSRLGRGLVRIGSSMVPGD
jgi:sigma-E factor negative regulatory protein RseB